MTQRKRLKQLHWDKIRTVPENSLWSKTPKVRRSNPNWSPTVGGGTAAHEEGHDEVGVVQALCTSYNLCNSITVSQVIVYMSSHPVHGSMHMRYPCARLDRFRETRQGRP